MGRYSNIQYFGYQVMIELWKSRPGLLNDIRGDFVICRYKQILNRMNDCRKMHCKQITVIHAAIRRRVPERQDSDPIHADQADDMH